MIAQTIGSQFPLVPMVNVKGLNSQATTDHIRIFSGIPLSSRMVSMNNPTSKSAEQEISYKSIKNFIKVVTSRILYYVSQYPQATINPSSYCFRIKSSLPKQSVIVSVTKKMEVYCESKCYTLSLRIKITSRTMPVL